jgi:hypothetical protein
MIDSTTYVLEIICNENNEDKMKREWKKLLPHILDFNYTADHNKLDFIAERIKEKYITDKSNEKNGTVQVSFWNIMVLNIIY